MAAMDLPHEVLATESGGEAVTPPRSRKTTFGRAAGGVLGAAVLFAGGYTLGQGKGRGVISAHSHTLNGFTFLQEDEHEFKHMSEECVADLKKLEDGAKGKGKGKGKGEDGEEEERKLEGGKGKGEQGQAPEGEMSDNAQGKGKNRKLEGGQGKGEQGQAPEGEMSDNAQGKGKNRKLEDGKGKGEQGQAPEGEMSDNAQGKGKNRKLEDKGKGEKGEEDGEEDSKGKGKGKNCGDGQMSCRLGVKKGEETFHEAKCFPADSCKTENILKELQASIEGDVQEGEDPATITFFQCGDQDPLVGEGEEENEEAARLLRGGNRLLTN